MFYKGIFFVHFLTELPFFIWIYTLWYKEPSAKCRPKQMTNTDRILFEKLNWRFLSGSQGLKDLPVSQKVSLDCTILFLGTFQAPEEPYYVLEIFLSFPKLGLWRAPCGPENVCRRPLEGPGLRGPRKGPVQNKKK